MILIDGVEFKEKEILEVRETLIELRGMALESNDFARSISLSYAIALLAHLADQHKEEN